MKSRSLLSGKAWQRELNSEAFIDGLQCMIDFTGKYGVEVSTEVKFLPRKRQFLYLKDIIVGNETSVSPLDPENLETIAREFKEATGKEFSHEYMPKRMRPKGESVLDLRSRVLESRSFEKEYVKANPGKELTLPHPANYENGERKYIEEEFDLETYLAINIHTHPSNLMIPSPADLEHLQQTKEGNESLKLMLEDKRKILPNPIGVIVGPEKEEIGSLFPYYSLLIFQEKFDDSIYFEEEFFDYLSQGFYRHPSCMNESEKVVREIFGETELPEATKVVQGHYNVLSPKYFPHERKMELPRGESWSFLTDNSQITPLISQPETQHSLPRLST
jgi:proteasome lid subunit RPN8/RPN11